MAIMTWCNVITVVVNVSLNLYYEEHNFRSQYKITVLVRGRPLGKKRLATSFLQLKLKCSALIVSDR